MHVTIKNSGAVKRITKNKNKLLCFLDDQFTFQNDLLFAVVNIDKPTNIFVDNFGPGCDHSIIIKNYEEKEGDK